MVSQNECTGCGACMSICPVNAVRLQMKGDGFWYPVLDRLTCIDCNLCHDVCFRNPWRKQKEDNEPAVYAAYSKNSRLVRSSSSGGIFGELAESVIGRGGVVYGAVQKDVWTICHEKAEDIYKAADFRKSKYLQSYEGNIYRDVKKELDKQRLVLYSGVGCQIAGLLKYLNKDYPNLYTCEVVCHGVPSRSVLKKFFKIIERKYKSKVTGICYRDKREGWNRNHITLELENGRKLTGLSAENLYHKGYLAGLYNRESCYQCQYAKLPRIADITLADYWNYRGMLRRKNHNFGISLVMCTTERGNRLFQGIKDNIEFSKSKMGYAADSCYHLTHPPVRSPYRELFLKYVNEYNFGFLLNWFLK